MQPESTASLVEALRAARLLEPSQLEELEGLRQRFSDSQGLARELVRRGWLTAYQAKHLVKGRGGDLVLGSYVLLDRLGKGGMGQVFKARNWKLGRIVAVKLVRKERLVDDAAVRRFHREIQATAALSHPNIVQAYDADEVRGTHFFVMEYVAGEDLACHVRQHGPLTVAAACDCIRQAALGLQHAHEKGMVHRDVKPHNLLRTPQGVIKGSWTWAWPS
jgi:serine/threonine protein kinase